jgi:hypothetical protein
MMPVKGSHTRITHFRIKVGGLVPFMINITHLRIKPLALASGHGRHMTVSPERALLSVGEMAVTHDGYKFVTVLLLKPPCGGFRSETATCTQKWLKKNPGSRSG